MTADFFPLLAPKLLIEPRFRQEFFVAALLDNLSLVENDDSITIRHRF